MNSGILEQSRQYEGVVRTILVYMQCRFIPDGSLYFSGLISTAPLKRRAAEDYKDLRRKRPRLESPNDRVPGQSPLLPTLNQPATPPLPTSPPASNYINYEAFEQPVASPQDPNQSYNIQPETNQSDQELSTGLQLRQRHQQNEELVPYSTQHATVDTSALEAPYFGGSASNLGPQLQLPTETKVPDTAQSIQFAVKGNIDGLKHLFSQGLASPRDVSSSRGFSLVRVGLTTPSHPNLISKPARKMLMVLLVGALRRNAQL